jgi:hypothetical protein
MWFYRFRTPANATKTTLLTLLTLLTNSEKTCKNQNKKVDKTKKKRKLPDEEVPPKREVFEALMIRNK